MNTLPPGSKPEVSEITVVKSPETGEMVDSAEALDIQEEANLAVHLQRLLAQPFERKVDEKAESKEHREITLEEAVRYVLLSAQAEHVDLAALSIESAKFDKKGVLLGLIAKSAPNEKGDYKEFTYKTKQSDAPKVTTNIDVSDWEGDNPDFPMGGDIVAEYANQQWKMLK
jgi:hypothetical protein